jgi:3-oxoadipate enol-lactonase
MQPIPSRSVKSGDAEIFYWSLGDGPAVVVLHPFPVHHEFWMPVAEMLSSRYRVVFPDLRGHGDSSIGDGLATMEKHAADLRSVMDDAGIGRAPIFGVSIGGYLLFEFWRSYRSRVAALALSNTKAPADNAEGRARRLEAANDVFERGTEPFFQSMLERVLAPTTRESRPDLVDAALGMMRKMSPLDVALVQRGMADRPDSVETLKTINVPTLLITGAEDILTGVNEAELMRKHIPGSQMRVIPKAGHYAAFEQPEQVGRLLRQFLDSLAGSA